MLKTKVWFWALGLLFMQAFVICVLRDFFVPVSAPVRHLLEILLPGFKWLTLGRFLLGLAESFLWGAYVGLVLVQVLNVFVLKHRHYEIPAAHRKAA
ncbi:MAG TPA: hypothetical protein VFI72_12965 [Candidatus Angelobacter sp.]|jgi:hypothetical protein|nr:hypothetical protein [Candidatus Angelobacter sp.]